MVIVGKSFRAQDKLDVLIGQGNSRPAQRRHQHHWVSQCQELQSPGLGERIQQDAFGPMTKSQCLK